MPPAKAGVRNCRRQAGLRGRIPATTRRQKRQRYLLRQDNNESICTYFPSSLIHSGRLKRDRYAARGARTGGRLYRWSSRDRHDTNGRARGKAGMIEVEQSILVDKAGAERANLEMT